VDDKPLTKADLTRAVELSAQALREMLEEEEPVDAVLRGKYETNLDQLTGQMYNYGKRAIEREPRGANESLDFGHGWAVGAHWMLEKMIGYVTGEEM
jgi:hypothetical protein